MPKSLSDITDAELSVMEVLWDREGGATVREIVLAIYGKHEHSLHGGVKSFLDRLMSPLGSSCASIRASKSSNVTYA